MAAKTTNLWTLARTAAALSVALLALRADPASAQTLVIGNGSAEPASVTLCPQATAPSGATNLDAFTMQATVTDDVVTRITVQFAPAGSWVNVRMVEITNSAGTTVYGSAIPGGDQVNVYTSGLTQTVAAGATTYYVRITPQTHAAMPAPNIGQAYAITGTVASVASNNPRTYSDTGSATITIDNLSPPDVKWTSVTSAANSITLNWAAATNTLVLQKQAGPVTDSPVEGTASYVAGNTIGGSVVTCVGVAATNCLSSGLVSATPYYYEVFAKDTCGNYSMGSPIGPLFPNGTNEGNLTANTTVPVVGIINPMNPATVTNSGAGFRVQVRAFSRVSGTNAAQLLTAVRLKAATPGQTFTTSCTNAVADYPINLTLNANYPSSVSSVAGTNNYGVYEANVVVAKGPYTLRACATNATNTVLSGPVGITVNDGLAGSPKGDGNLLVRDNGGQLCSDCHTLPTHSSESVGNKYGSWYADCRDCHTPHSTTNVELIRKQITPPGVNGQQPPRMVVFSNRTATGYSATGGANSVINGTFANGDATGVCQVCHTRTTYYLSNGTLAGSHNPTQPCTGCHLHTKGLKAACNTCHGAKGTYSPVAPGADSSVSYAPPTAADGTNTLMRVGAHQAHVNGRVAGTPTYRTNPILCADCHPIPNTHNGTRDAAWSVLATNTIINGNTLAVAPMPAAGNNAYNTTWEATPTCTNACHGANIPSNTLASRPPPNWTVATALTCASCHGAPPPLASPSTLNQNHPQNVACATCHGAGYNSTTATVAKATHINGTLNLVTSGCTSCHGELGFAGVTRAVNTVKAAPGATGSGTNSYDTTGLATGNSVGAHKAHLVGSTGTPRWRSTAIACTECHLLPISDTDTSHATGAGSGGARATLTFSAFANTNVFESPVKTAAYTTRPTCTAVYCHDPKSADTAASQNNAPNWTGATTTVVCGSCHGLPPVTAAHPTGVTECGSCHPGYATTMPTSASTIAQVNTLAHINGVLDGGGDCTGCHASQKLITKGPLAGQSKYRRPIVSEFTTAGNWSHKRSGGYTVSKYDCCVCHMEGDPTTGDPVTTGAHMDGYVNLRDPDTGLQIKSVTWGGTGAGAYTSNATDATFPQFSRNLGSNVLENSTVAIMVNQCLKCHDSNGALSTSARVPVSVMPSSSAAKPFGTTIAGNTYVGVGVTAGGVQGGVADVNESFKVTNSSYHPVSGKQNNSYASGTRMAVPWSMTKTAGSTTSWGYLISCWDCHAPTGTTNTAILTGTVTAHGGPATVRGNATTNATSPSATAAVTLCQYCHALYGTGSNHGAGSAFSGQGNSGMGKWLQYGCNACHSSGYPTMAVRPARAQDAHGVNALPTGGKVATGRWSTGADKRPYAFLRNTVLFTNHAPASISGTAYTAICAASSGGSPSVSCQAGTYTVGGTY